MPFPLSIRGKLARIVFFEKKRISWNFLKKETRNEEIEYMLDVVNITTINVLHFQITFDTSKSSLPHNMMRNILINIEIIIF